VESSSSGASLDANSGPKTSGRQAAVDPENSSRAIYKLYGLWYSVVVF